ncbi:MAG: CPBP family intramembrane glutamic endopeptidase [Gemmatimonadota bacterium]
MADTAAPALKPIGLLGSLLYFGIPSALFSASILGLLPWMIRHGYSQVITFFVTFGLPLSGMLVAAFVAYRLEGRPWTWPAFRDRMRLRKPTPRDWLWTLGLAIVATFGGILWGPVAGLFSGIHFYTAPPEFVTVMTGLGDGTFGGMAMHGRWDIFLMMALCLLILNIGGEELWWRGIILPRQELAFGKWAWLVNGLLWDLFHFFYHTSGSSVVGYMLATIPLAFVAQKTRNTWPGIIVHLLGNRAALLMVYYAVTR